jgi:hypothetical protein
MSAFVDHYPYLAGDLIWLAVYLAVVVAFESQRRQILLGGLLAMPCAATGVLLVPSYWSPERIATLGGIGVEDLLFNFIFGGMAWAEAVWIVRKRIALRLTVRSVVCRYGFVVMAATVAGAALHLSGMKPMHSMFLIMGSGGATFLLGRRQLWPIAAVGLVTSAAVYAIVFRAILQLWPHLLLQWTLANLSGWTLWTMPVEELTWALLFGPAWAISMAFVFDARLRTAEN